jgi:hypothetical protein
LFAGTGSRIIVEDPSGLSFLSTAGFPCWCLWRRIWRKRCGYVLQICASKSRPVQTSKAWDTTLDDRTISGRKVSGHAVAVYPFPASLVLCRRALSNAATLHASLIPAFAAGLSRLSLIVLESLYLLCASSWKSVWLRLACGRHMDHKAIVSVCVSSSLWLTANDVCSTSACIAWPWRGKSRFGVFERPALLAAA